MNLLEKMEGLRDLKRKGKIGVPVQMSNENEIKIGCEVDEKMLREYPVFKDETTSEYIRSLGEKIVSVCDRKDIPYVFKVLRSQEINAFAAPGGFVYITTGLLKTAENEAEVASVLGHEVGHIVARHTAQRLQILHGIEHLIEKYGLNKRSRILNKIGDFCFLLAIKGYGRQNEYEADHYGALYASKLGYDPSSSITMFNKFQKLEENNDGTKKTTLNKLLASHPPTSSRITELEMHKAELPTSAGLLNQNEYSIAMQALNEAERKLEIEENSKLEVFSYTKYLLFGLILSALIYGSYWAAVNVFGF